MEEAIQFEFEDTCSRDNRRYLKIFDEMCIEKDRRKQITKYHKGVV